MAFTKSLGSAQVLAAGNNAGFELFVSFPEDLMAALVRLANFLRPVWVFDEACSQALIGAGQAFVRGFLNATAQLTGSAIAIRSQAGAVQRVGINGLRECWNEHQRQKWRGEKSGHGCLICLRRAAWLVFVPSGSPDRKPKPLWAKVAPGAITCACLTQVVALAHARWSAKTLVNLQGRGLS